MNDGENRQTEIDVRRTLGHLMKYKCIEAVEVSYLRERSIASLEQV